MNHGRWMAKCPACATIGATVALLVKPGDVFICPEEYPDLMARMLVPHSTKKGAFLSVSDEDARKTAREIALREGDYYEIEFPENKSDIERILRNRPVSARNWNIETTAEELRAENFAHGVGES